MYKEYQNKDQYNSDFFYINNKVNQLFGGDYQKKIKHPTKELYYITFCRSDIFDLIRSTDKSVLTDEWLVTDIVQELPNDFFWFDQTRNYRLIVDSLQVLDNISSQSELGTLLINFVADFKDQIFRVGIETQIYLSELSPYQGITTDYLILRI